MASEAEHPVYVRSSVAFEAAAEPEDVHLASQPRSPGALAVSACGSWVAACPADEAGVCRILHVSASGQAQQQGVFQAPGQQALTLCAWSSDAALVAAASGSGGLYIFTRGGEQRLEVTEGPWRRQGIAGLFSWAGLGLCVLARDGCLHAVDPATGGIQLLLSAKERAGQPRCCALDTASGLLCIASEGAQRGPCISLWRLPTGGSLAPEPLAVAGRPARPSMIWSSRSREVSAWSACISSGARHITLARPGHALQTFTWEEDPAGKLRLEQRSQAVPEWAAGAVQIAAWNGMHVALLSSGGNVAIAHAATWEQAAHVPGFPTGAVMAPAMPCNPLWERPLEGAPEGAAPCSARMAILAPAAAPPAGGPPGAGGWQLVLLQEKGAQEELAELIARQSWHAALALAQRHGLPTDRVLKARWVAGPVTRESMEANLAQAADRAWAAEQCLSRTAADADMHAALLECGLADSARFGALAEEADASSSSSPEAQSDVEQEGTPAWWRCRRLQLLSHQDRLRTFLDMHSGAYSAAAFEEFKDASLKAIAAALARCGALGLLQALLRAHPYSLAPHLLQLLDALPETLPPAAYLHLLPQEASPEPALPRGPDWVESARICAELRGAGQFGALVATEHMARLFMGWHPPSSHQVGEWLARRALDVDARTGLLGAADAVLAAGAGQQAGDAAGGRAVKEAAASLRALAQSGEGGEACWAISLEAWAALDTGRRARLLADTAPDLAALRRQLAALLAGAPDACGRRQRADLLARLLAHYAPGRLAWCAQLVEAEAQRLQVFPDAGALAEAACAAAYACPADSDWPQLAALLGHAASALRRSQQEPQAAGRSSAADDDGWDDWEDAAGAADGPAGADVGPRLEEARRLAGAAQLLSALGSPQSLGALHGCAPEQASRILRTALARFSRAKPPLSEQRWAEVWRQLRELRDAAFPALPPPEVLADLCTALLRCGQWRLAGKYLAGTASTPLDPGTAEALVLDCARDFFFSAPSLEAPEARACLEVLPASVACAAERGFIGGVLRLAEWGVQLPPLQYRQVGDRMELLQMALEARPRAYAESGRLALLAELLGVAERHAEVRERQAAAALAAGDTAAAAEHAVALAAEGFAPAWRVAAQVLHAPDSSDAWRTEPASMRALAAFVLTHCQPDQAREFLLPRASPSALQDHLEVWKRLRVEVQPAASSAGGLHALLMQALKGAQGGSPLPDVGDAALALACLLALEAEDNAPSDERLLQGLSFAASRSVLLLRMFACGLQALSPNEAPAPEVQSLTEAAQQRLAASPWQVHAAAVSLKADGLTAHAQSAREQCIRYHQQLTAAGEERALRSLLPTHAVGAFTAGRAASEAARQQQLAALLEVVEAAGQEGPPGQQRLQQAQDLAARYGLDAWPLAVRYGEACLLAPGLADADGVQPQLLERPMEALQVLVGRVWERLPDCGHARLTLVLDLTHKCLSRMEGHAEDAGLQAAVAWVQRAARAAPGLSAKLFVSPALAAAARSAAPAAAQSMLLAACAAHAPPDAEGWAAERPTANGDVAAGRAAGAAPHARRQLFSAAKGNGTAAHGSDDSWTAVLAEWHARALAEVLQQVSHANVAKLAALVRSLPDAHAQLSREASQPQLCVGYSAVLLALACKALSEETPQHEAERGSQPGVAEEAAPEEAAERAQREYKACRKLLRQLAPAHLAALLRYALLQGPHPLGAALPQCRAAHALRALRPGGALRAQGVQDAVALLQAALGADKGAGGVTATRELEEVLSQLRREAASLGLLARLRERAGLSAAEAAALQRALAQPPDDAPRTPSQTRAAALQALLRAGCSLPRLLAAARCFQDAAGAVTDEGGPAEAAAADDSDSSSSSSSEGAEQVVQAAAQALLQQCTAQLRSAEPGGSAGAVQALDQGLCASLEDGASAPALLGTLRGAVWAELQGFVLLDDGAGAGPLEDVLRLLASLAPPSGASESSRWPGWAPGASAGDEGGQLRRLLLLSRTQDAQRAAFPAARIAAADVADAASAVSLFQRLLQGASDSSQLLALLALLQGPWRDSFERNMPQLLHAGGAAASLPMAALAAAPAAGPAQLDSQGIAQPGAAEPEGSAAGTVPGAGAEHAAGEEDGWEHAEDLDLTEELAAHARPDEKAAFSSAAAAEGLADDAHAAAEAVGWHNGNTEEPTSIEAGEQSGAQGDVREQQDSAQQGQPDQAGEGEAARESSEQGQGVAALHACWAALLPRMLAQPPGADAGGPLAREALQIVEAAAASSPFLLTPAEALSVVGACRSAGDAVSAITLGLLMPHPEAQAAAQDALQTLDLQPGAAADAPLQTLAAVLLSKHLWPLAARAPAYPTLTRALLARPALLPGDGADGKGASSSRPPWRAVLAPAAAVALARDGAHADAASLSTGHLGLHPALATLGSGLSLLGPYLQGHQRAAVLEDVPAEGVQSPEGSDDVSVPRAIAQVWGSLSGQCERALARFRADSGS